MTGQSGYERPDTVVRQKRERKSEENSEERDSPRLDLGDEDSRRRQDSELDITADFETWYRQYPRKAAKAAASKAYRAIIAKKLATTEELLAGAMRYAAERCNQDPRYSKHPATWLNGGCWTDEPTKQIATTIDIEGKPIQQPPPWQQKRSELTWDDLAGLTGRRVHQ